MLEIFKLIYEYSKSGKLVDKEFIENFIRMEVHFKNLKEFVQEVKFEPSPQIEGELITASSSRRTITIYLNNIEKLIETYHIYLDLFSCGERLFFPNYLVSEMLSHEIEHRHNVNRKMFGTNIDADLLRLSDEANRAQYYAFYDLDFDERYANIRANMKILSLLSYIAPYVPNLMDFFKSELLEYLISSYKKENDIIIAPTLEYFHLIEADKFLPNYAWYNKEDFDTISLRYRENVSLADRLLYGFPITNEEYEMKMDELRLSRKWKIDKNES